MPSKKGPLTSLQSNLLFSFHFTSLTHSLLPSYFRLLNDINHQSALGEVPIARSLYAAKLLRTVQGSPPVVVCNRPSRIAADEASGYHCCGSGDGHGTIRLLTIVLPYASHCLSVKLEKASPPCLLCAPHLHQTTQAAALWDAGLH